MYLVIIMPKKSTKKTDSDDEFDDIEDSDIEEDKEDDKDDEIDDDSDVEDDKDNILEGDTDNPECLLLEDLTNDELLLDELETDIIEENGVECLSKENRVSNNRLTKYEMVRILGERTKELTMGAKPLVKNYKTLSYEDIAIEEFKKNMTPFKIKRPLPDGKYEIWTLDELYKDHLLDQLDVE